MNPPPKLVFVYNADNGLFNAIAATAHRIFSPATYECSLCLYTYDLRGMRREWKRFLESLGCELEFFYRTDFREAHPDSEARLPAVFVSRGHSFVLLIESDEIKACGNLEELMLFTRRKVEWARSNAIPKTQQPTQLPVGENLSRTKADNKTENISQAGVSHL